jgi:ABC-type transport system involved in multi-copper enzyme maturation permease subunit
VRLLLYKFFAAVLFVFLYSTPIVALCALGLYAGTRFFNPWFLVASLSATVVFAVLYPAAVLVGVLTRSGNIAALAAAGIWGIAAIVGQFHHISATLFPDSPAVRGFLEGAYVVLPKVADVGTLNARLLASWQLSPAAFERTFESVLPSVEWATSVGTTAAFSVACLALAAWFFRRRDF